MTVEIERERVWPGRPGYHTREECDGGYEPHIHLRSSEAIVYAKPKPPHADGERHRYRIVCLDCGEEGTVRLSIDPEAYREDTDATD